MKQYDVTLYFTVAYGYTVEAENEEEALQKARDSADKQGMPKPIEYWVEEVE